MTFKEQFLNSPPYHISCYRSLQIGHESAGGGNGINEIKMKSAKSLLSSNKTKQNRANECCWQNFKKTISQLREKETIKM